MKKTLLTVLMILSLALIIQSCVHRPVDPLDSVKQFKADDKYFKASLKGMHFYIEVYPIDDIETNFTSQIKNAKLPIDPKGCADGIYTGETPEDTFDYRHVVELEIKDGAIVSIDYDEIKSDGHGKESDSTYNTEMSSSGSSPAIAYPIYEKQMLEKQNMLEVDAVSGASYSLYRFRLAVTIALMKARLAADN